LSGLVFCHRSFLSRLVAASGEACPICKAGNDGHAEQTAAFPENPAPCRGFIRPAFLLHLPSLNQKTSLREDPHLSHGCRRGTVFQKVGATRRQRSACASSEIAANSYHCIYEIFLSRFTQSVQAAVVFPNTEARVFTDATPPRKPSAARVGLSLALAEACGPMLGVLSGLAVNRWTARSMRAINPKHFLERLALQSFRHFPRRRRTLSASCARHENRPYSPDQRRRTIFRNDPGPELHKGRYRPSSIRAQGHRHRLGTARRGKESGRNGICGFCGEDRRTYFAE
jgi:hypothetical protein